MMIFIVWIVFILLEKKANLNHIKKDTKIRPFAISVDRECLMKKIAGCKNNPKNLSKTKVGEHFTFSSSISEISPLNVFANP